MYLSKAIGGPSLDLVQLAGELGTRTKLPKIGAALGAQPKLPNLGRVAWYWGEAAEAWVGTWYWGAASESWGGTRYCANHPKILGGTWYADGPAVAFGGGRVGGLALVVEEGVGGAFVLGETAESWAGDSSCFRAVTGSAGACSACVDWAMLDI